MAEPTIEVVFAGSGAFAAPSLRALLEAGVRVVEVWTQPDRPAGRGRKMTPTAVAEAAAEAGLEAKRTADINAERPRGADLLVVIAFGQKIAAATIQRFRLGGVNLHASLLPRHRGAAPIHHAILAGDRVTGNSVIRLAQRMDAGAVLGQSRLEIGEMETCGELHDRLAEDGARLLTRVVADLAAGRAQEQEQDESQATLAGKVGRESARLDFTADAESVARRIRAMYPWPGCGVRLVAGGAEAGRLTLVRARPISAQPASAGAIEAAGTIDAAGRIVAGLGAVEVVDVQPEGGRVMSLRAYRNGRPWPVGAKVESL